MPMSFKDSNILIVGGTSGIGSSLLDKLKEAGANLWCMTRQADFEFPQGRIEKVLLDVVRDDLSSLQGILPEQLQGLVYCPGTVTLKPFRSLEVGDFREDLEINLFGAVRVLKAAQKNLMAAGDASVVLFSTVAAQVGMNFHASVAAAKAAVEGFALSLAAEWASKKIRVNVIAPSLTDTPLAQRLLSDDKKRAAARDRHPLKRIGLPDDCAAAALFLLSAESSWITGQIIGVDGGLSTLKPL